MLVAQFALHPNKPKLLQIHSGFGELRGKFEIYLAGKQIGVVTHQQAQNEVELDMPDGCVLRLFYDTSGRWFIFVDGKPIPETSLQIDTYIYSRKLSDSETVSLLLSVLSDPTQRKSVRLNAAKKLSKYRHYDEVNNYIQELKETASNEQDQKLVDAILKKLGVTTTDAFKQREFDDKEKGRFIQLCVSTATDQNQKMNIRIAASKALHRFNSEPIVRQLVTEMGSSLTSEEERKTSAKILRTIGGQEAENALATSFPKMTLLMWRVQDFFLHPATLFLITSILVPILLIPLLIGVYLLFSISVNAILLIAFGRKINYRSLFIRLLILNLIGITSVGGILSHVYECNNCKSPFGGREFRYHMKYGYAVCPNCNKEVFLDSREDLPITAYIWS